MVFAFVGILMKSSWRAGDDGFKGGENGTSASRADISGSSKSALLGDACDVVVFPKTSADAVVGTVAACVVLALEDSEHTWPFWSRTVKESMLPIK